MAAPTTPLPPSEFTGSAPAKTNVPFDVFPPEPDPLPTFLSEVTLKLSAPIELPEEDGEPLESFWHYDAMVLLIQSIDQHLRDRDDYVVGGNHFIYYNEQQARNTDFRGPDFFFVWGRPRHTRRKYWATWDELGLLPNVIIELMSPSTRRVDLLPKKTLYQNTFKTSDYFCYDPFTGEFHGWTLQDGVYVALEPNERGWRWSAQLQLWLGLAPCAYLNPHERYLRFFTPDGTMVRNFAEAGQEKADAAQKTAEDAQRDADRERLRAQSAEAELARLNAQLEARDKSSPS